MEKTKLGISVPLLGAGLYFTGIVSFQAAFILGLVVLYLEDNQWLKQNVIKMIMVVVIATMASVSVDALDNITGFGNWYSLNGFDYTLQAIIGNVLDILLFIMGLNALAMKSIKIGFINKFIETYF